MRKLPVLIALLFVRFSYSQISVINTGTSENLSSISINPAGSALFNNNTASVTLTSINRYNKSNYMGTKTGEHDNAFDLNQAGIAFVFKNKTEKSPWCPMQSLKMKTKTT